MVCTLPCSETTATILPLSASACASAPSLAVVLVVGVSVRVTLLPSAVWIVTCFFSASYDWRVPLSVSVLPQAAKAEPAVRATMARVLRNFIMVGGELGLVFVPQRQETPWLTWTCGIIL